MNSKILFRRSLGYAGGAAMAALLCFAGAARADDAAPRLDSTYPNYQPPYPDPAQINGEQGDVVLKVWVNGSGHVRKIGIARSSGFPDLDNAAIEGVWRWHYVPSRHGDDNTTVKISYRLPTAMTAPPNKS